MSKEKPLTAEELKAIVGEVLEEKLPQKKVEESEQSTSLEAEKSKKNEGGEETPKYQCKNGHCNFYSDDGFEMILHQLEHMSKPNPAIEETPPAPKMRHGMTAEELVNCPECRGRLEKAFEKVGYSVKKVEPEPKKEEKPKKRGLF